MKYTNISMSKSRKYNLGNYETRDVSFSIDVELEKGEIPSKAFDELNHQLKTLLLDELENYIANN